jgi:predicted HAD superfamily phosphohydrolase YqeG
VDRTTAEDVMGGVRGLRVPLIKAASLQDVPRLVPRDGIDRVAIVDLDNTIVPYDTPEADRMNQATEVIEHFGKLPGVGKAVVVTNGPGAALPGLVSRARKPFTSRRRLGLTHDAICWVVGDQIVTDGLLAWRLRAPFFLSPLDTSSEPKRARMQRRVGALLERLFFVEMG